MELQREALIDVAMGYEPADTIITGGRVVNVHTGTIKAKASPSRASGSRPSATLPTPSATTPRSSTPRAASWCRG